jgi:hypothetical protein
MKLKDLLAANALVRLSPFLVVGGVLLAVLAVKDLSDQAGTRRAESSASKAASPGMATCAQAAARYNKDQWKSLWDSQEVLCKEADTPGSFSEKCLDVASNIVLEKPSTGDDIDVACFGVSETDQIRARCLSGELHLSEWKGSNCGEITGMTYMEFMSKP